MSRIFLDTNIIIDLLAERNPHYDSISKLATLADQKKLTLVVSPLSFTTVVYVLSKYEPSKSVISRLRKFKILCELCEIGENIMEKALNSNFPDFEDATQYYCAMESNCTTIITRNGKDFKHSTIPIMTSEEYLKSLK